MGALEVTASFVPTPEQLAESFWNMGSDEQAAFYAHLRRIAGTALCFQAAYIVSWIAEHKDNDARDGFNTLHGHAVDYVHTAIDIRAADAKRAIARMGEPA